MADKPVTEDIVFRDPRDLTPPDIPRKSLGDMDALCKSLDAVKMLQPIGVTTEGKVILGERRRQAAVRLGWTSVPTRVLEDLDTAVLQAMAERDENTCREPLSKEELGARAEQLLKLEKAAAEARQKGTRSTPGTAANKRAGELPARSNSAKNRSSGEARIKVGKAIGVSGQTAERMAKITAAAKSDPAKYGDLPALMDKESVAAAWKEYQRRQAPAKGEMLDAVGQPIPEHLRDLFGDPWLDVLCRELSEGKKSLGLARLAARIKGKAERYLWVQYELIAGSPDKDRKFGWAESAVEFIESIIDHLKQNKPYAVCPCCGGKYAGKTLGCKECRHSGAVPEYRFRELSAALPGKARTG